MPDEQRSATIWDDAVFRTEIRDLAWIDTNLGAWMRDYFGHNENYILDRSNTPFFASQAGEPVSPDAYRTRADIIDPMVVQLRSQMAALSEGLDNVQQQLAEVAIVTPV